MLPVFLLISAQFGWMIKSGPNRCSLLPFSLIFFPIMPTKQGKVSCQHNFLSFLFSFSISKYSVSHLLSYTISKIFSSLIWCLSFSLFVKPLSLRWTSSSPKRLKPKILPFNSFKHHISHIASPTFLNLILPTNFRFPKISS